MNHEQLTELTPQLQHSETSLDVHVAEDLQRALEFEDDGGSSRLFAPCKGYVTVLGYHIAQPDDQDNEND
jgi:hypothetical protein